MSNNEPWTAFSGSGAIILAVALLIITGALAYASMRLRHPLVTSRPGKFLGACIIVSWLLAVLAFLVAITVYVDALIAQRGDFSSPSNPITPITAISGVVAFVAIVFLTVPSRTHPISLRAAGASVGSAVVGAIAAPMIFELPYDLIVMWRTHPPTPASLYTLLFFLPLFVVEVLSFAMLTCSPFMRVSRATLWLLAAMFLIFAVWALFGFGYPSSPAPFAFNATSKVIAFATAVSLFLPVRSAARAPYETAVNGAISQPQSEPSPERAPA